MNRILVTGASGQIGSELVPALRARYGIDKVVASDIRVKDGDVENGLFECLDVTDAEAYQTIVRKYKVNTIIHLAALLSATAEANPLFAWTLNMNGLLNALETARESSCRLFTPSSIGAFGPGTPKHMTPQVTIQRPSTMYGINKVAGELLCDYYYMKYGVDTRSIRFPGLISYSAPPGGGTTDYAVDMYVQAVKQKRYTSYIAKGTFMDMMYMEDAVQAIIQLMEADSSRLRHRNAYNLSAMSVDPETIACEIRKHIPAFALSYELDPVRQSIADSWPDAIDTTAAVEEWGFQACYTLESMTRHMIFHLEKSAFQNMNRLA